MLFRLSNSSCTLVNAALTHQYLDHVLGMFTKKIYICINILRSKALKEKRVTVAIAFYFSLFT